MKSVSAAASSFISVGWHIRFCEWSSSGLKLRPSSVSLNLIAGFALALSLNRLTAWRSAAVNSFVHCVASRFGPSPSSILAAAGARDRPRLVEELDAGAVDQRQQIDIEVRLKIERKAASAVVHPSCSINHLNLAKKLHAIAAAMADEAVTPVAVGCCAFAGDRGLLHAELTRSATAEEAEEVRARKFDAYLGSNRTCELGMNLATGKDYESFIYLLEELTRPSEAIEH